MMSEQEMKSMEKYALDILKNNPSPKWVTVLQTESGSMVFSFDDLTGEDTAAALKQMRNNWYRHNSNMVNNNVHVIFFALPLSACVGNKDIGLIHVCFDIEIFLYHLQEDIPVSKQISF